MPWSETSPMDQKTQFIADVLRGTLSVVELCDIYGISRKTAYKWIDRYVREGPGALLERSRRPQRSPNSTPPELVQAIVEARRRHPSWGRKETSEDPARQTPALAMAATHRRLRHPQASGSGGQETSAASDRSPRQAHDHRHCTERSVVRRLQGPVQNPGWPLSARLPVVARQHRRWRKARVYQALQRVRPPQPHPHRQRRAVRDHHLGAALSAYPPGGCGSA